MMKFKKIALALGLIVPIALNAMEHDKSSDITAENIMSLLPQLSPEDAEFVESWKHENAFVLSEINSLESFNDWKKIHDANNALLKERGLENTSASNYVIKVPKTNLLAKIAGQVNIRQNILQAQDVMEISDKLQNRIGRLSHKPQKQAKKIAQIRKFHDEQFDLYTNNPVATYQGISRAAHGLLVQRAKEQHNLDDICVPTAFIASYISNEEETKTSDGTHFVLEEFFPDLKKIDENSPEFKALSPNTIVHMLQACQAGYLWCVKNNLGIRQDNKTVVFYDLEQPNCYNPHTFFKKDIEAHEIRATFGITDIVNMVKQNTSNPDQYAAAKVYIQSNAELKDFAWYNTLENLIK